MNIRETIKFVLDAHGEQKYGKAPFIIHPMLVARHFEEANLILIALLHDVLEDTKVTYETIVLFWGVEIADAVIALTRNELHDESYGDYIIRLSRNKLAVKVKIADLEENMFSARVMYPGEYSTLEIRYKKAYEFLTEAL